MMILKALKNWYAIKTVSLPNDHTVAGSFQLLRMLATLLQCHMLVAVLPRQSQDLGKEHKAINNVHRSQMQAIVCKLISRCCL